MRPFHRLRLFDTFYFFCGPAAAAYRFPSQPKISITPLCGNFSIYMAFYTVNHNKETNRVNAFRSGLSNGKARKESIDRCAIKV
jgi:hypothetical protein